MAFEHFMMCVIAIAVACAAIGFVIFIGCFACSEVREARIQRGVCKKVKHAHWISSKNFDGYGNRLYMCSNCRNGDYHSDEKEVPYCWSCGSRMDEEE